MPDQQLTAIPGIGPATARTLADAGYSTVKAVAKTSENKLSKVPGFGNARAAAVIAAAQGTLAAAGSDKTAETKKKTKDKKGKKLKAEAGEP